MTLNALMKIAVDAGERILEIYNQPSIDFESKSDNSPVTRADREAEDVILAGLSVIAPDVPVVAEEEVAAGRIPATSDRFYLVDPLDGTKEFISRNGEFTVNIALVEDGVPVLGVVYAPALGDIYAGDANGAIKGRVIDGEIVDLAPIATRCAPSRITAVGSRSHGSEATAEWLKSFEVESFVSRGSSLKLCLVAAGEADIYPRLGRTMEWDIAAGDAVLRAAGGLVTTMDGSPFPYNKRNQAEDTDFANPHFVAYGDKGLIGKDRLVVA